MHLLDLCWRTAAAAIAAIAAAHAPTTPRGELAAHRPGELRQVAHRQADRVAGAAAEDGIIEVPRLDPYQPWLACCPGDWGADAERSAWPPSAVEDLPRWQPVSAPHATTQAEVGAGDGPRTAAPASPGLLGLPLAAGGGQHGTGGSALPDTPLPDTALPGVLPVAAAVPVPGSALLCGAGLLALLALRRKV